MQLIFILFCLLSGTFKKLDDRSLHFIHISWVIILEITMLETDSSGVNFTYLITE